MPLAGGEEEHRRLLMEKNIGTLDRGVRIVLGLAIIGLGVYFKNWLGLIGVALILSGLIGWCGLYKLLGINTCKIKKVK